MTRADFFSSVRASLFQGKLTEKQVEGMERLLTATNLMDPTHRAYILATVFHETGATMQPVRETFASSDQQSVNRLEAAWSKGQLTWVKTPYWRFDASGKAWFGRGYVQITHRENYARIGELIGVDLVGNPSLALDPDVATKIAVVGMQRGAFTGVALRDFLPGDYRNARKIINGTESAAKVAGYAEKFEVAVRRLGSESDVSPRPVDVIDAVPAVQERSIWQVLIEIVSSFFKGRGK